MASTDVRLRGYTVLWNCSSPEECNERLMSHTAALATALGHANAISHSHAADAWMHACIRYELIRFRSACHTQRLTTVGPFSALVDHITSRMPLAAAAASRRLANPGTAPGPGTAPAQQYTQHSRHSFIPGQDQVQHLCSIGAALQGSHSGQYPPRIEWTWRLENEPEFSPRTEWRLRR